MSLPNESKDQPLWIYPKEDEALLESIVEEFRIHPVTAQVLVSRGISSIEEINNYLYAKLPDLYDPQLFPEMNQAIARVAEAFEAKQAILIYGDNDVDGMTGTALLVDLLKTLGAEVFYYVPNRNNLKQSLLLDALDYALKNNCKLLITVDCGITAAQNIEEIVKENVDVMITDHHEPTDTIPHCVATLNPKLNQANYPNRELTGVGVAFKLAHALINNFIERGWIDEKTIDLKDYLDLVALGTISDMGALLDENRILVRYGLQQMKHTKRIGLSKLFTISDLKSTDINVSEIASKIAPRLNSLGRIADPRKGVELLLIQDAEKAEALAQELNLNNIERRKIERNVSVQVDQMLQTDPAILKEKALVLYSPQWHPGVIPIVTTRLARQYNRPIVMLSVENGHAKGSARSIREFPLLPILKNNEQYLINFGGHDYAAGLTMDSAKIEVFKQAFIRDANAKLKDTDVISKLSIDARVDFEQINFDFMESLNLLCPYGNENPAPVLYCDVIQTWPPKIIGKQHLKLYVEQNGRMLEGIAFGMASRSKQIRKKNITLRIAFTPQINDFQNKISIQLLIRDFHIKQ